MAEERNTYPHTRRYTKRRAVSNNYTPGQWRESEGGGEGEGEGVELYIIEIPIVIAGDPACHDYCLPAVCVQ